MVPSCSSVIIITVPLMAHEINSQISLWELTTPQNEDV